MRTLPRRNAAFLIPDVESGASFGGGHSLLAPRKRRLLAKKSPGLASGRRKRPQRISQRLASINQSCVGCSRYLQHPKETHRPSSMSRPVPHPFPLLGGYRGYGCYPQTGLFKGSNFFNAAGHLWEGSTGVLQLAGGVHSPTSLARPDRTSWLPSRNQGERGFASQ